MMAHCPVLSSWKSGSGGSNAKTKKRKRDFIRFYARFEFFSSRFNKIQIILENRFTNSTQWNAENLQHKNSQLTNSKIILKKKKPIQAIIFFDVTIRVINREAQFPRMEETCPETNDRKTR